MVKISKSFGKLSSLSSVLGMLIYKKGQSAGEGFAVITINSGLGNGGCWRKLHAEKETNIP